MFCKNCGAQLNENAAFCINCGITVGCGNAYCSNCGSVVMPNAVVCLKCGAALGMQENAAAGVLSGVQKSRVAAGLLGIFLGGFGAHNFYLGYTGKATAQVLMSTLGIILPIVSCGVLGILVVVAIASGVWGFVEGIMLLCGSIQFDGRGIPLKE